MQREKIVSVSGLKGFSSLIIMFYHYRFFLLNKGIEIIDYGHYFVEVFVTISGFLMAYNYRNRIAGMKFNVFFMKRYLKIMPLYWITEICVYAAVILSTFLSGEKYRWNPMKMLLEFSGFYTGWFGQTEPPVNNPLWTVCCLLLCYVLYYFICKASKNRNDCYIGLIVTIIFTSTVSLIWLVYKENYYSILGCEDSIRCIISFLMGLLLYELYEKIPNQLGEIISYILIGVFVAVINAYYNFQMIGEVNIENIIPWMVVLLFCPLMLCSTIYIKPIKFVFSGCVLQFIGKLSMDIYMWHWVVRIYLGSRPFYLNQEIWSGWVILIIVTFIVSVLSHYILMPLIYGICVKINSVVLGNRHIV